MSWKGAAWLSFGLPRRDQKAIELTRRLLSSSSSCSPGPQIRTVEKWPPLQAGDENDSESQGRSRSQRRDDKGGEKARKWPQVAAGQRSERTEPSRPTRPASGEVPPLGARCRLTARTRDNQCALHGSNGRLCQLASDQQRRDSLGAISSAPAKAKIGRKDDQGARAGGAAAVASAAGQTQRSSRRGTRHRKRSAGQRAAGVPTWPLAKAPLGAPAGGPQSHRPRGVHFGDCEDILSPHLAGRLLAPQSLATGAVDPLASLSHRRPFAETFERPSTGWLYNATGLQPINQGAADSLKGEFREGEREREV